MGWLAVALLAVSWLWGVHYFAPTQLGWWLVALVAALVCMVFAPRTPSRKRQAGSWEGATPCSLPAHPLPVRATPPRPIEPKEPPAPVPIRSDPLAGLQFPKGLGLFTFLLFLVPAWCWPWPWKAAPLAMLAGLLGVWFVQCSPMVDRFCQHLSRAAIIAGMVLLLQALALEAYMAHTARTHELPGWLRIPAVAMAKLVDFETADNGTDLVFRVLGNPHRIGITWEWFLDPATVLFFAGGLVWLAWNCLELVPTGRRWTCWLRGFRRLTGLVLLWLPFRWMLVLGLYLHRAALEGIPGEPLAISQLFSPWVHLGFLMGPVLLVSWSLRGFPWTMMAPEEPASGSQEAANASRSSAGSRKSAQSAKRAASASTPSFTSDSSAPPENTPVEAGGVSSALPSGQKNLFSILAWIGTGTALVSLALVWTPIGRPKPGRILVVERHSQWEPTIRPYDTTWYGEPSGYNYRVIYDYSSHFFEMGRILESEPINDQRLQNGDILIIKTPTAAYSPEEIAAIDRFVARGGGLLLIGDHTNVFRSSTYLNAITRPMGFTFRNDLLFCIGSPYEQAYRRPWVAHPAVQHVSEMDFAVSCSIDPANQWGRAAIRSTGLWSLPAAYQASNYHPHAQYLPHLRAGAFVQLWATSYGRGRVLAFTDSTIFSNFCTFQPGKAELFLNMLQWLNHTSPFDPWGVQAAMTWGLGLAGLLLVSIGLIRAYLRSASPESSSSPKETPPQEGALPKTIALVGAGLVGGTLALATLSVYFHWAMPPLEPQKPYRLAVIDRTVSQVPLTKGAFNESPYGFGLLEHTIPRLGYFTARRQGSAALQGDLLVVLEPTRSVPHPFREELIRYVAAGGGLLVLDSPDNRQSTANSLLEPFGIQIQPGKSAPGGTLTVAGRSTGVSVEAAAVVAGGEPLVSMGQNVVAARTPYGEGTVLAIGFGQVFTDGQMHPDEWQANWMPDPPAQMLARYELFYALFRALVEPGPMKVPEKPGLGLPPPEAPVVPEAPLVPEHPSSLDRVKKEPAKKEVEKPQSPSPESVEKPGPSLPKPSSPLIFPKALKPSRYPKDLLPSKDLSSPKTPEAPEVPKIPP